MKEQWIKVKGYEEYYMVSNHGRVKRIARTTKHGRHRVLNLKERILNPTYDKGKYLIVTLYDKRSPKIHRLVAENWIPNPNNLPQVNHIDGNKDNNNVSNLEWITARGNTIHAWEMGLCNSKIGEDNPNAKFTNKQVLEIKSLLKQGIKQIDIAKMFNTNKQRISSIKKGITWYNL